VTPRDRISPPSRGRRAPWLVIALAPLLLATSCPPFIRVDAAPGATYGEPEFRFSSERKPLRGLDSVQVFGCPDREVYGAELDSALRVAPLAWSIVREPRAPARAGPFRLTYGRVPDGYRESGPARPLQPGGCYYLLAKVREDSAPGIRQYEFALQGAQVIRLLPDGRTIAGIPSGPFLDSRPFREINHAAVGCKRGYRRVRTEADTAAVRAREYEIMDTRLSCGWLYAHWPGIMSDPMTTERSLLLLLAIGISIVGAARS
jgi:hypothetical protein